MIEYYCKVNEAPKATHQEKGRIAKQVEEIKNILEEYGCNPDDYDSLKTACEIWNICTQPVRDSHINLASFGALDAAADQREE